MSRIRDAFENGKAFIPFITCGDPDLETTKKVVKAAADAGADLIELGIPFSDPTAEGSVIQEASIRALQGGATTDKIFEMAMELKGEVSVPMVFMTYANVVYSYGIGRFGSRCKESGICGVILPDVPYEEKDEFEGELLKYDVELVSLIAPTSAERTRMIARDAKGFIYIVSSLGVTGVRSEITTDIGSIVSIIREETDVPCAVGFGISRPDQAAAMAAVSDGAIVGSAIVRLLAAHGKDAAGPVGEYVKEMKDALRAL